MLVGVLQVCVMSPRHFNVMLEMVMALVDVDEKGTVLFGARISNIRFANDIALLTNGQSELQHQISNIHSTGTTFGGLKISTSKARVQIHQLWRSKSVKQSWSKRNSSLDIKRRINLATGVTVALDMIGSSKEISKKAKVRLCQASVLSVLLYNSETWIMRRLDEQRL